MQVDPEDAKELPFKLPGTVVYASTEREVEEAVSQHFRGAQILGFDIEWPPNQSEREDNDIATIQIATLDACLVAHVAHMKVRRCFRASTVPRLLLLAEMAWARF